MSPCGQFRQAVGEPLEGMVQRRNAVEEYASAHKEHGRGAGHGQPPHQPGCASKNGTAQAALHPGKRRFAAALAEVLPAVVELDDAPDEAVNAHRHDDGDGG